MCQTERIRGGGFSLVGARGLSKWTWAQLAGVGRGVWCDLGQVTFSHAGRENVGRSSENNAKMLSNLIHFASEKKIDLRVGIRFVQLADPWASLSREVKAGSSCGGRELKGGRSFLCDSRKSIFALGS